MSKIALSGNASGTGTFTIASPDSSTDRTLDLPDASGTVLSSDSSFGGSNQTWQDVLASRATGVTYTNSTNFPIQVAASAGGTGVNVLLVMEVAGVEVARSQAPTVSGQTVRSFVTAVVPAGATYVVTRTGGSIVTWAELR
jgi:hypothetical protein